MERGRAGIVCLLVLPALAGCRSAVDRGVRFIDPEALPGCWRTHAERTEYAETARYAETVAFCRRLADESPWACYTSFGRSGQGRELPLLILSRTRAFTPAARRASGKPLVLLQNCIHAGECAGKDACLELARDIVITGTRRGLLEHVDLLIMPIFNVDGHERFGPYGRINQRGPREMGWRTTARNLNLNRDYLKADAVEMRHWLRAWVKWQPDLLIDNHTTDGSDHQYELLYGAAVTQLAAEPIIAWTEQTLLPTVLARMAADGHLVLVYGGPRDRGDPSQGIVAYNAFSPRFSTGYGAIANRPALLLEAHAYKSYARRVRATYDFIVHTLEEVNRRPAALRAAVRAADAQTARWRGADAPGGQVVLRVEMGEQAEPFVYKALALEVRDSDIIGGRVIEYLGEPRDVPTVLYRHTPVVAAVMPPLAYLVPPEWQEVIDRLGLHGIEFFRLGRSVRLAVGSYRFEDVTFPSRPYEGRLMPEYRVTPLVEEREFPPGTVVIPLAQPRARIAVHLLEPEAPDCLVRWGFFNSVFEQKEYVEAHVIEPLARQMLADDPELRREFEQKLLADEDFARSPRARAAFFYRRSPYWDQRLEVYPVARVLGEEGLTRLRSAAAGR